MARLNDVCRKLALQACLDAVIACWVFLIAFDPAPLAVVTTATRLGVSLSGNRFARLLG